MKKKYLKTAAAALSLVMLLTGCSGAADGAGGGLFVNDYLDQNGAAPPQQSSQPSGQPSEDTPADNSPKYEFGTRGTSLSLTADKELNISRISTGTSPAPNDGIWTVFAYICGSDLESDCESATDDLLEMQKATAACSDLRFVVEAGGSKIWHNDICADGKNTRLVISGGEIRYSDAETANMGDPMTLVKFLEWGLENYRSQYIMLDMWDHGGGSLNGVCFDERYNDDSISLNELDMALTCALGNSGVKLDMIGCDACLMASVELANMCVPYADYMLASEETEWGYGWDYAGFSNGINAGAKEPAALGKYVCDAFYDSMDQYPEERFTATLSVIDLSKIDKLLRAFNSYCIDIYDSMRGSYDKVLQSAGGMIKFSDGKPFMGDMHSFIKCTSRFSDKADRTLSMLNDCVTYKVNGDCYKDAGGISIVYPFSTRDQGYINIAKKLCVTPYYLGIIDSVIYGKASMGDITGYDPDQWVDDDSEYWSDNDVDTSEYEHWNGGQDEALNNDMDQAGVLFAVEPHIETRERETGDMVSSDTVGGILWNIGMGIIGSLLSDEYNVYTFTLSDSGLQKVNSVQTNLFAVTTNSEDRTVLVDLGGYFLGSGDEMRNSNTKTFEEEFYGMTVGLPNFSAFSVHPISRRYVEGVGNVNMYYAPIMLNGENRKMIFGEVYTGGANVPPKYIAVGTVDLKDGDAASRIEPLNSGDTIKPIFPAYYTDTMEFAGYLATALTTDYVLDQDGAFGLVWNAPLPNGTYAMSYLIDDIYGNSFVTPPVKCVADTTQSYPYAIVG